jgi:hypothetical protein
MLPWDLNVSTMYPWLKVKRGVPLPKVFDTTPNSHRQCPSARENGEGQLKGTSQGRIHIHSFKVSRQRPSRMAFPRIGRYFVSQASIPTDAQQIKPAQRVAESALHFHPLHLHPPVIEETRNGQGRLQ